MMKKYALAAALVATAALAGCDAAPETVEVVATETTTHTTTPSPSTTADATTERAAAATTTQQETAIAPGDPRLIMVEGLGTTGMFMNPDTGKYYVCNGGELTAAQGSPVESGTCAGPYPDYNSALGLTSRLSDAVGAAIANELEQEFGPIEPVEPVDMTVEDIEESGYWDCIYAGGTEETCGQ